MKEIVIKGTVTELAHTQIWQENLYLGYIIRNTSQFANINENWNFVSKSHLKNCFAKTKEKLINLICTK